MWTVSSIMFGCELTDWGTVTVGIRYEQETRSFWRFSADLNPTWDLDFFMNRQIPPFLLCFPTEFGKSLDLTFLFSWRRLWYLYSMLECECIRRNVTLVSSGSFVRVRQGWAHSLKLRAHVNLGGLLVGLGLVCGHYQCFEAYQYWEETWLVKYIVG